MTESYEKDLSIDNDSLDVECLRQPQLFAKYSGLLANAELAVKRAYEKVKTVRSDLILWANKNPDEALGSGTKPSDPKIEAFYRTHKDYKEVKEDLHQKEYERDILQTAVIAFKQRKDMIENLIRLWQGQYFAGPVIPRDLSQEMKRSIEIRKEEISEARKEKLKRSLNPQRGREIA